MNECGCARPARPSIFRNRLLLNEMLGLFLLLRHSVVTLSKTSICPTCRCRRTTFSPIGSFSQTSFDAVQSTRLRKYQYESSLITVVGRPKKADTLNNQTAKFRSRLLVRRQLNEGLRTYSRYSRSCQPYLRMPPLF